MLAPSHSRQARSVSESGRCLSQMPYTNSAGHYGCAENWILVQKYYGGFVSQRAQAMRPLLSTRPLE